MSFPHNDNNIYLNHNRHSSANANAKTISNSKIDISIDDNDFIVIDSSSLSTIGSNVEYEHSYDNVFDFNYKNYDVWKHVDEFEFEFEYN